jgi:hypothetical protein
LDNKRLSKKREVSAAKDIGGKAHTASGALWHKKSDFSNDMWNLEDKFTHEDKYSIQYSILRKIEKESLKVGKLSGLRFGFHGTERNYMLIEKKHLTNSKNTIIFTTHKNSILFKLDDLIKLANNDIMCEIIFEKYNKNYIMMTWNYFIENYRKFLIGDF